MKTDVQAQCVMHLRAATACLEQGGYSVLMVRLLDIVDEIEKDMVPSADVEVGHTDS